VYDRKCSQHFQVLPNSSKMIHFRHGRASSRPSTSFLPGCTQDVDARHKAGHDEGLREITPYLWVHPDEER
jgi:hypothetical protein